MTPRKPKAHTLAPASPTPFRMPDPAFEQVLAEHMGLRFENPKLFRLALTHRSVLHDWLQQPEIDAILQSNERLEFLGDSVLGMITAERLYQDYPEANEGQLTRNRAALVRAETLVQWARELRIPDGLYLGTGESITTRARDRMLAGAFEALVGAIYVDQGREAVAAFIDRFLDRDMAGILAEEAMANPKGRLQEIVQERRLDQPAYETIAEEGPDHAREFTVAVLVDGKQRGFGKGRSKREAQQAAAREALASLMMEDEAVEAGQIER
jgi:ribonuclease-3